MPILALWKWCAVITVVAVVAFAGGCASIMAPKALSASEDYADAINHRDIERMITLTDPEVLKRTSNGDELRAVWPRIFSQGDVTETVRDISPGFNDAGGMLLRLDRAGMAQARRHRAAHG